MVAEVQRRVRFERFGTYPSFYLPSPCLEEDREEAREIIRKVIEAEPADLSDFELESHVRSRLKPLARKVEARNRRGQLIEHGRQHVWRVLDELYREEAITREERYDLELRKGLEEAVTDELEDELTGSETDDEVDETVEAIVAEELDLEPEEDEQE